MKKNNQKALFSDYFLSRIASLKAERRYSTAANYFAAYSSFQAFLNGQPMRIDQLDRSVFLSYNEWLSERGICRNSISFYNRILRAVCNRARFDSYDLAPNLFKGLYTGVDQTRKRALPMRVLRQIVSFDASGNKELSLSRDLFLFSFYARGMSFVDMAFLRKGNLAGDMLSYVRRKTGRVLVLHLEPCMKEILNRCSDQCFEDYLLPIIHSHDPALAYSQYRNSLHHHNAMLKDLGSRCGAEIALNSYAARHSWATLARQLKIPVSLISSGLGHSSEKVTQIYLDSISQNQLDEANSKVVRILQKNR